MRNLRAALVALLLPAAANAAVFTVTNTNDSGAGSLRQAITDGNNTAGGDSIHFSIGSGIQTIRPLTPLPIIREQVAIDGTTQPGWNSTTGHPIIELDGSLCEAPLFTTSRPNAQRTGLRVSAPSYIRGLVINRFAGTGIGIGDDFSGNVPHGTAIFGCWIGLGVDGSTPLPNGYDGIAIYANDCVIGGAGTLRNVVSANGENGIAIGPHWQGQNSSDRGSRTRVEGNFVGTDLTGTSPRGNTFRGIYIETGSDSVIGGDTAAKGNVVAANGSGGVGVFDIFMSDPDYAGGRHVVRNNRIGQGANGGALGNGSDLEDRGLAIRAVQTSVVQNTIAHNSGHGVAVHGGYGNVISQNAIFSNRLGIDLTSGATGSVSVTPNDTGDGDTGGNTLINFPVITEAVNEYAHTRVAGVYNGAPSQTFTLEFYVNPACDSSGYGEGETYLGSTSVSTNASGAASFSTTFSPQQALGTMFTATARDVSGNTSEFSACSPVIAAAAPVVSAFTPSSGPFGEPVTITGAGFRWVTGVSFSDGNLNTSSGGIYAAFTIIDNGRISTSVPFGARDGYVRVEGPYGSSTGYFNVSNPHPTIDSISPDAGPTTGGTSVTITGTGFLAGATVQIGNSYATGVTVHSASMITATTVAQPADITNVSVFNTDGLGAYLWDGFEFYCTPSLSAEIASRSVVMPYSTGNVASVPDAGPGVTYSWSVYGGTITAGAGTRSITFSAGAAGGISIYSHVDRGDCAAASSRLVRVSTPGDLDGDGRADLVWQNGGTGQSGLWLMNGFSIAVSGYGPQFPSSSIKAIADFDGDGNADLLWHDAATGAVLVSLMNGTAVRSSTTVLNVPADIWTILGSRDTDGDGKSDVLWRNTSTGEVALWRMNGPTITSAASVAVPSFDWQAATITDLNGDGKGDVVWKNTVTNEAVAWFLDGSSIAASSVLATPPPEWTVSGSGDFDGSGTGDLLWRNTTTSEAVIWLMAGTSILQASYIASPNSSWAALAVGDFDGNGKADIFWRNSIDGDNVVWLMDGLNIVSSGYLLRISDQNWTVAGPR